MTRYILVLAVLAGAIVVQATMLDSMHSSLRRERRAREALELKVRELTRTVDLALGIKGVATDLSGANWKRGLKTALEPNGADVALIYHHMNEALALDNQMLDSKEFQDLVRSDPERWENLVNTNLGVRMEIEEKIWGTVLKTPRKKRK